MRSTVMLRRVFMGLALDPTMLETFVTAAPGPDPSIVEGLYRDRGRELWAFGRRLGLAPDECDDAVQEAHLRLWTSLAGGAGIDDPAAWLYRVFYRIAMDRHRLSRRIHDLLQRWPGREWTVPAVGATEETIDSVVWAAVDHLPPRQRAAVYLHYRADLAFDRVAQVMGITPGAARTHASRGIEAVRRHMATINEADR
jgi:RNA polymerase sigma-70 factor (ECF subfamily)